MMNIEQAEKQAELVYEANVHLGEEAAQRLYDETLKNLLADADAADGGDADADAEDADAADADGGVSVDNARRAAVIDAPTTSSAQYSARRPEGGNHE